jgi:hypothetical protein
VGSRSGQLISIPFALPAAKGRFIGVVDGMASLVPLAVVLVVVFGKSYLLGTPRALGDRHPAHGRECGGCIRRLCVQYRAQSSDIRCQSPAVFLKMSYQHSLNACSD